MKTIIKLQNTRTQLIVFGTLMIASVVVVAYLSAIGVVHISKY